MFVVDRGCYLILIVFSRKPTHFVLFYSFLIAHNKKNDDNKIIMIITLKQKPKTKSRQNFFS